MAQACVIGHVVSELELKVSANNNPYIRFSLAERIGYGLGEKARIQYIQVWAFGNLARQLQSNSVVKGSFIMASGSLELVDYTKKDGVSRDKQLKLILKDWDFVTDPRDRRHKDRKQNNASKPSKQTPAAVEAIDGDREPLPG